jgi:outer membrane protein OmpA-like peptidoglycan-associated protein
MKKITLLILLLLVYFQYARAQIVDTLILSFPIGVAAISEEHNKKIQELEQYADDNIGLLIYGFADYLGKYEENKQLSIKRVENVVKSIQQHISPVPKILVQLGLGQVDTKGSIMEEGNPQYRTVYIIVRKINAVNNKDNEKTNNTIPAITAERIQQNEPNNKTDKVQKNASTRQVDSQALKIQQQAFVKIDAAIQATAKDSTFVLEGLYFHRNTYILVDESLPVLRSLLKIMKQYPGLKIKIEGHICCNHIDGINPESNSYLLSIDRAENIYQYLILNGIAKDRMLFDGYGTTRPIVENDEQEADAIKNRRVEIRIIEK